MWKFTSGAGGWFEVSLLTVQLQHILYIKPKFSTLKRGAKSATSILGIGAYITINNRMIVSAQPHAESFVAVKDIQMAVFQAMKDIFKITVLLRWVVGLDTAYKMNLTIKYKY